jgi:hypothetical protein
MINARCVMKRKAKKKREKEEGEEKRINVYDKTYKSLTKIMKNGRKERERERIVVCLRS